MRIVVKIGSALLSNEQTTSGLDETFIEHFVQQIGTLHQQGNEIVLVTSGAVATGRVGKDKSYPIGRAAMVGQPKLMTVYSRFFEQLTQKISVGQALYTYSDLKKSKEVHTKERLLQGFRWREITIVNANDAVINHELKALDELADNDQLAAKLSVLIEADALFMLTDVDGLYRDYGTPNQKLIKEVLAITDEITRLAQEADSTFSRGGMKSKIGAARLVTSKDIKVVIANGRIPNVLLEIMAKINEGNHRWLGPGTLFWPKKGGRDDK